MHGRIVNNEPLNGFKIRLIKRWIFACISSLHGKKKEGEMASFTIQVDMHFMYGV